MSPIGSRLTALALLGLTLTLVYLYAVEPLWQRFAANRDTIDEIRFNISRFEALVALHPQFEQRLSELERRREGTPLTLPQPTPTLAAAALQEHVKRLVLNADGTLTSTQALEAGERDRFAEVSVIARMTLTTPALQQILHALESEHHPILVVTELTVQQIASRRTLRRTPQAARRVRGQTAATAEADSLDVRLRITGYLDPDR